MPAMAAAISCRCRHSAAKRTRRRRIAALQAKYSQLKSRQAIIRRADLGAKGVFYRAMVGPFESGDEADQFCNGLKQAGGQCIILRN